MKVLRPLSSKRPLSRGEERVLAVLHHLRNVRNDWESKVASESSASTVQENIAELEVIQENLQQSGSNEKSTFFEVFSESKSNLIAIAAVASFGIGIVVGSSSNSQSPAPLFYLLGVGGGVASVLRTNKILEETNKKVERRNNEIHAIRQKLGKARKQYSEYSKIARSIPTNLPSVVLGSAYIPLENKNILGNNFVLDPSGLINPSQLKAIALRDLSTDAERILQMTKKLENIPVLLTPNEESLNESKQFNAALHGQERELKEAVSSYVNTLSSIKDEELTLRALKPTTALGQAISEVLKSNECIGKLLDEENIAVIIGSKDEQIDSDIARFEDLHRDAEAVSSVALSQLDQINGELQKLCQRYNLARTTSTNTLHTNYYKVLNRASWCSKKFYCPRTILSKNYLLSLIGLDFDQAHTLEPDQLLQSLHSDSVISNRLSSKSQLVDDLLRSHEAIIEIMYSYQLVSDEAGMVRAGSEAEHIIDQYKQELALFRQRLVEAVTGSPNGFLGISESARLYYDPTRELWSSPVLPYTYTNTEVERFGQVLRTQVDLVIPLWEHLWTEKADFRKSELFRTNESIQRMSEKEGEKIKQIGYQFQADLREVRSNMFLAKADFDAKLQELDEYEEGIKELGLMDESQLSRLQNATSKLEAVSKETSGDAGGYEQILMLEPKNQLMRRQSNVHDPIDVIKSPDLLIEGGVDRGVRRLLYANDAEVSA